MVKPDFAAIQKMYRDRFQPATPEESFLIDEMARNRIVLDMLFQHETQLLSQPLNEMFADGGKLLGRLQRRVAQARKAYDEALTDLLIMQEERRAFELRSAVGGTSVPQGPQSRSPQNQALSSAAAASLHAPAGPRPPAGKPVPPDPGDRHVAINRSEDRARSASGS